MYKEINIEKIKTLEKDLLDTISELKSVTAIEEEIFVERKKDIFSLRYLLIEALPMCPFPSFRDIFSAPASGCLSLCPLP